MSSSPRSKRVAAARTLAGVSLLASLLLAPWLFASTRAWAVETVTVLLAGGGLAWITSVVWNRRRPAVPRALVIAAGWLIGVSAVGNMARPHFPQDPFMVEQIQALRQLTPGSFIVLNPWQAWAFVSASLLGMLAIVDLAERRTWWNAFYWVVLFTGASIAALGLVQVVARAPALLWDTSTPTTEHFFATFFHYPPAGAFLNLTWPLAAVLMLTAVLGKWRDVRLRLAVAIAGGLMTALLFAALFNQRSRTAQALGVLVGFVFTVAAAFADRPSAQETPGSLRVRALRGIGWVLAAAAIGWVTWQSPLFATTKERWRQLSAWRAPPAAEPAPPVVWDSTGRGDRLIESNHPSRGQLLWDRRLAWGTALRMIAARPWAGFGLRGWTETYHHFTDDPFLKTFFLYVQFTHHDVLQALVEWGLLGTAGWGVVIAGGVWRALGALRVGPAKWSLRDWQRLAILLGLAAVFLHGFIEFPLQIPSVQWAALALLALLWARAHHSSHAPRPRHHREHRGRDREKARNVSDSTPTTGTMNLPPLATLAAVCFVSATAAAAEVRGDAPEAKPLEPAEQLRRFKVPPGFEVQLVSSEPQIQKPLNITFDAAGRLWVTGSELYPFPAQTDALGRPVPEFDKVWQETRNAFRVGQAAPQPAEAGKDGVRILSDFDENGRARHVQIFADGLNIPTGVQPYKDGAIVFSIPNIWKLRDSDGDGHADTREVLYGSFGFEDTHGMSASYLYWIDGWIYGTHGFRNKSEVRDGRGHLTAMHSGNTYRFRPDGSHFEIYTNGQTNPFGLTVDPLGNFYSADSHSKPVYLLLRGGFYPGIYKQHDGLGFAPAITNDDHGSSAIAGIAYYAAEQFPEEYRGNVFIGNPVTRRINRDRFEWQGSTPKAVRMPDFLTCDDPWFRPVQVKLGPDGALYIADFYNPIIGHYEVPLTDPRRDHTHGRIWRVVWRGENQGPVPAMPDLSKLDGAGLVAKLGDPNLAVRTLATNELVDRIGGAALEPLREVLKEPRVPPAQRAHALLAGHRLSREEFRSPEKTPGSEARDWEEEILRALMLKMPGAIGAVGPEFGSVAQALSSEGSPAVKRAAWEALVRAPDGFSLGQLLGWLPRANEDDPLLHYAAKVALRDYLKDPRAAEALRDPGPVSPWAAKFLSEVLLAVPSAASAEFLLEHLESSRLAAPRSGDFLRHVALHLPAERLGRLAGLFENFKGAPQPQQLAFAHALGQAGRQRGLPLPGELTAWTRRVTIDALGSPDDGVVKSAIEAARESTDGGKVEPLAKIVTEARRPIQLRAAALEAVANSDRGSEVLVAALGDTNNMALQKRAAELLGQRATTAHLKGEDAFATLLAAVPVAPWELAVTISASLVKNEAGADALLRAIEAGKASPALLRHKLVALALASATSRTPGLEARAAGLTAHLPPEDVRLDVVIAQRVKSYRGSRSNPARGGELFQQHCAACHRFGASGGNLGPSLDGVAARGVQRLAEDILDPNRNVDPAFRQTLIETTDGAVLAGANLRDAGDQLLFNDAAGKEVSVARAGVKAQTISRLSLMPPIYEQTLSGQDFADLIGFLVSTPM